MIVQVQVGFNTDQKLSSVHRSKLRLEFAGSWTNNIGQYFVDGEIEAETVGDAVTQAGQLLRDLLEPIKVDVNQVDAYAYKMLPVVEN